MKEIANIKEDREKEMKMLVKAFSAQIENEDDVNTSSNDVQIIEEKTNKQRRLQNIKEAKIKKKKEKIRPSTREEKKMWLKGLEISIESEKILLSEGGWFNIEFMDAAFHLLYRDYLEPAGF